ncbi:MAG: hypothetical protein Q8O53_03040, partial [Candidatus Moranbacteria bacterium]|nr:hypothetical protein [Candidatus Moranbacteria bacterium]
CFCFICLRRYSPVYSETTSKSTWSLNFIDKIMQKESEKRQLNSWIIALFFALVIFAFAIGGIWIGILSIVIGTTLVGWKDRHKGPFRIQKRQ